MPTPTPFRLGPTDRPPPFVRLLERLTGLEHLDGLYRNLPPAADSDEFLDQVLTLFNVRARVAGAELEQIPREGGAVVVANHPFGAVEGVILAQLLRRVRPDAKIMANAFLGRIPELRPLFIGVDPFGGADAPRRNAGPLREAVRWVRDGGLLAIFPAGEVASLDWARRRIVEPQWSPSVARLVRMTGVPVVPVHFAGSNSALFHAAGLLHPRLRTALLARELINKQDRTIPVRIGRALALERLAAMEGNAALAGYLRLATEALANAPAPRPGRRAPRQERMALPAPPDLVAAEVGALSKEQWLGESGDLAVFYARADEIPRTVQEIGRLREVTFRETGEGTGKARDIDLFDAYYLHLVVWDRAARTVVGAYRLGLADRILERFGRRGLYSHSLFRYRRSLLAALGPAIELGRSFVRPEYQRSYSPLLLLWKGIAGFVARHPRYRVLFGPVSISNDYRSVSRQLLVEFLEANHFSGELAAHVRPRRPFRRDNGLPRLVLPPEVEALSEVVSEMEADGKGVPILLRQYLKLGGRLLGFNVDPKFSDALDGLLMVDLRETDPKVLARYMGREAAQRYLDYHREEARAAG